MEPAATCARFDRRRWVDELSGGGVGVSYVAKAAHRNHITRGLRHIVDRTWGKVKKEKVRKIEREKVERVLFLERHY